MKKRITILSLLVTLLIIVSGSVFAQTHELVINPPTTSGVFLNAQILADSTAFGTRKDPDRVYVLKRGGIYFANAYIKNVNWALNIKAEAGTGRKPLIYMIRNTTTNTTAGRFVWVNGNINFQDIAISGYLEADPSTSGDILGGLIQTNAAGYDIVVNNCILTNSSGNHIRTDSAPRVIKVTNTIFSNMGWFGTSNFGAGKAIDVRAGSCDTLILENNTFVNFLDRIVRHYQSTAAIKYFRFNHNTVVNGCSYHGMLSLGKLGDEVVITNNLLLDPFALGEDVDVVRQAEFSDSGEKDAAGQPRMTWIFTEPTTLAKFTIKNNYYGISTAGQAFYTKNQAAGVKGEGSPLTWFINRKLGADSTKAFTKETITMTNIPRLMVNLMDWYRSPSGGNKTKNTPTSLWNPVTNNYDNRLYAYYSDSLNCRFPTTAKAYTGADKGLPAGALTWWGIPLGVEKTVELPTEFNLSQNYPNPFNPTTKIEFSIPKAGNYSLKIYNMLGQEIASLLNGELSVGTYKTDFDASKLSSGVYIYKLSGPNVSIAKKMVMMK